MQKTNLISAITLLSVAAMATGEPLLCCRKHINKPDHYALEETAMRPYNERVKQCHWSRQ
jgi:hypothetical protein